MGWFLAWIDTVSRVIPASDVMIDKLLLNLDVGVPGALLRTALGAVLVVVVRAAFPGAGWATAVLCLLVLLFGIKAFAVLCRAVVPASAAVRAHWEWRRNLARFHDSYQWRKLVWFGMGILLASRARGTWELPLAIACLVGGSAGEILWRRVAIPLAPPVRG
jgi:hypothetical protein